MHFGRCVLRFGFPLRAMFFPIRVFRLDCLCVECFVFLMKAVTDTAYCVGVHSVYMNHAHKWTCTSTDWNALENWNEVCARLSCWIFQPRQFSRVRAVDGGWCACCCSSGDVQIAKRKYISTSYLFAGCQHRTELKPELVYLHPSFFPDKFVWRNVGCEKLRCDVIRNTILLFSRIFSCPLF